MTQLKIMWFGKIEKKSIHLSHIVDPLLNTSLIAVSFYIYINIFIFLC